MHRILQRRRVRKLRVVWASLAVVAVSLAACSALFTAWTWRQTRDLSQSFQILQDRLEQVSAHPRTFLQLLTGIQMLCNFFFFFCSCGYGNRRGGCVVKHFCPISLQLI